MKLKNDDRVLRRYVGFLNNIKHTHGHPMPCCFKNYQSDKHYISCLKYIMKN